MGVERFFTVVALGLAGTGPSHAERLLGVERRPWRFRDHTDAERIFDDLENAGDRSRFRIIYLVRPASLDWGAQHGAIEHARDLHVDRVLGRAVDLRWQLNAHDVLADQPELARLLEIIGGDLRRHYCRDHHKARNLAVSDPPARFGVNDDVRFVVQLGDRNTPVARRIVEQHAAHLGAELAHRLEVAGDAYAGGGVHHMHETWVAVDRIDRRRRHDAHLRPVGIEFLSEN